MARDCIGYFFYDGESVYFSTKAPDGSINDESSILDSSYLAFNDGIISVNSDMLFSRFPYLGLIMPSVYTMDIWPTSSDGFARGAIPRYFDADSLMSCMGLTLPSVPSALPSLNGNGAEFFDGDRVKVQYRDAEYTVDRSFFVLYADNSYTTYYDLTGDKGSKLTCPQSLLTAIPAVTAP